MTYYMLQVSQKDVLFLKRNLVAFIFCARSLQDLVCNSYNISLLSGGKFHAGFE